MNTPNVHAGRLERRVRLVDMETMSIIHELCSLFPFGAIRGVPLLRLTALVRTIKLCAPYMARSWLTSPKIRVAGLGNYLFRWGLFFTIQVPKEPSKSNEPVQHARKEPE